MVSETTRQYKNKWNITTITECRFRDHSRNYCRPTVALIKKICFVLKKVLKKKLKFSLIISINFTFSCHTILHDIFSPISPTGFLPILFSYMKNKTKTKNKKTFLLFLETCLINYVWECKTYFMYTERNWPMVVTNMTIYILSYHGRWCWISRKLVRKSWLITIIFHLTPVVPRMYGLDCILVLSWLPPDFSFFQISPY